MNIFSKLIYYKWVTYFLICFFSLFLMAQMGEFVNNILRNKYTLQLILENNFIHSSIIIERVLPISILLATLMTINGLKIHSELIALLSLGYSFFKISKILIFLGLIMAGLQFLNLGYLKPHLLLKEYELQPVLDNKTSVITTNLIWIKNKEYFLSYTFYDKNSHTLITPTLYYYNDELKPSYVIHASKAQLISGHLWNFINVTLVQKFSTLEFPQETFLQSKKFQLMENNETLSNFQGDPMILNFFKLKKFLSNLKETGINLKEYYASLYNIVGETFTCFMLILLPLALPFNPSTRSQSAGKSLIFGVLLSLIIMLLQYGVASLLNWLLVPAFISAIFIPLIFLVFIAWRLWPKVII